MLKNLLGNNSNNQELAEEMRVILKEMQDERARYQELVETAQHSNDKLKKIHEPISKATKEVDAVSGRLTEIEKRLDGLTNLANVFQNLEERATRLNQSQEAADARLHQTTEDSQRVRTVMEDLATKVDVAVNLKEQLHGFLEVEKPFHQLRGEADTLRNQVENTGDHLARLREQHDRLLDAHKLAMSKMEALDRRRDDMGRSLTDKERRVAGVEQAIRNMDGVQQSLDDARREMASLKATADLLGQKTATLEVQRETVDRALAQAEHLDQAMRMIDAGVKQQQQNERLLGTLQEQLASVRALHEQIADRSTQITQLQREIDDRTQTSREEMASVSDEAKKTMERFDFERRGISR
jgi:chromosome segregation ATPase